MVVVVAVVMTVEGGMDRLPFKPPLLHSNGIRRGCWSLG